MGPIYSSGMMILREVYFSIIRFIFLVFKYLSILSIALLLIAFLLLIGFQEKVIFAPNVIGSTRDPAENPPGFRSPSEYNLEFEDVRIKSDDDTTLALWVIKANDSRNRPTILFFQGNAGNMGFRLVNLAQMVNYMNVNIVAPSYRGFGLSTGSPSETGLNKDAIACLDYAKTRRDILDPSKIFIFGRSLGGAVALKLASERSGDVRGVIVENTFTSLTAIASVTIPFMKVIPPEILRKFQRHRFDSDQAIKKISCPIMLISGKKDELIPPDHMARLCQLARESNQAPLVWLNVETGSHNDTWIVATSPYYTCLRQHLDRFCELSLPTGLKECRSYVIRGEGKESRLESVPAESVSPTRLSSSGDSDPDETTFSTYKSKSPKSQGGRTTQGTQGTQGTQARTPRFYESVMRQLRRVDARSGIDGVLTNAVDFLKATPQDEHPVGPETIPEVRRNLS